MRRNQLAVTLYTTRDHHGSPEERMATLRKVKEIGYVAVQVSGMGDVDYAELGPMIRDAGLVCCATHEQPPMILNEPEKVVERLNTLGCTYTAFPSPGGYDMSGLDSVMELAGKLDHAGKVLRDAGQVLTYHNHHMEFQRVGGKTALEIIYEETDPKNLQGEIDTHWVQRGGGNPVSWCRRLKGRLPLLHMKDFALSPEKAPLFAEIGSGNLEWPEIVAASDEAGCEWYIVEQDEHWRNNDPFESLRISYDFLATHLCAE